jgi:hypothetical protein
MSKHSWTQVGALDASNERWGRWAACGRPEALAAYMPRAVDARPAVQPTEAFIKVATQLDGKDVRIDAVLEVTAEDGSAPRGPWPERVHLLLACPALAGEADVDL